ncbi:MAG: hypothetical protein CMJ47_13375 [Planctomyces sp.]|nr:hypothetical protein [Planctomyces sp.]
MFDDLTPKQRIAAFEERNGGPKVAVLSTDGNWWLYPNGARRSVDQMGALIDPLEVTPNSFKPTEVVSWENLQQRMRYHKAKMERAAEAFNNLRQSMMNTDYDNNQWQELERLQRKFDRAKKGYEKILKEEKAHPVYRNRQERLQQQADIEQRISEKNDRLKSFRI